MSCTEEVVSSVWSAQSISPNSVPSFTFSSVKGKKVEFTAQGWLPGLILWLGGRCRESHIHFACLSHPQAAGNSLFFKGGRNGKAEKNKLTEKRNRDFLVFSKILGFTSCYIQQLENPVGCGRLALVQGERTWLVRVEAPDWLEPMSFVDLLD